MENKLQKRFVVVFCALFFALCIITTGFTFSKDENSNCYKPFEYAKRNSGVWIDTKDLRILHVKKNRFIVIKKEK